MNPTIVVALIAVAGPVVTAGMLFWSSRRTSAIQQDQANLGWAKELRQDAADARREVAQLRDEVRELRRQLGVATREADHWIAEHQVLRRHAWREGMTIERLRELIGPVDPPPAGAH